MNSFKKISMVFFLTIGMAGCMHPLLTKKVRHMMSYTTICPIPERNGQMLRQMLCHAFQSKKFSETIYALQVKIIEGSYSMGLGLDAKQTVAHASTIAEYVFMERLSKKIISKGRLSVQNSYDILVQQRRGSSENVYYSSTKSKDFAYETNLRQLSIALFEEIARILEKNSTPLRVSDPVLSPASFVR